MAKHPAYFAPLYTATVRAGEKSGSLVDVLRRYIDYQKKMLAIRRKLISALAYPYSWSWPSSRCCCSSSSTSFPNFTQMFDQGGQLPFLTTMLISFTNGLTRYFPFVIAALAAIGAGLYSWQRTRGGKERAGRHQAEDTRWSDRS